MLNHITVRVENLEVSKQFFSRALQPLGYKVCIEKPASIGFGTQNIEGERDFWITEGTTGSPKSFSCLAFSASSKEMVDEFYKAALAAGGKDNGAPDYRPKYHAGYYAAFVIDPNGYNIEAVFDDRAKMTVKRH